MTAKHAARKNRKPRKPARGVTYDEVRELALALPGVADSTSYGTPALKVDGRYLAGLRKQPVGKVGPSAASGLRPGTRRAFEANSRGELSRTPDEVPGRKTTRRERPSFSTGCKDGETIALRIDFLDRQELLETEPETFFITDHYRDYPAVVVRLDRIRRAALARLLEQAWRMVAPKSRLAAFDA